MIKNILVFGAGYVGCSLAVLFAKKFEVTIVDIDKSKINNIKNNIAPIKDSLLQKELDCPDLNLKATFKHGSLDNFDIAILALPTNYNDKNNKFDTSTLEQVITKLYKENPNIPILIKSTIPIGFTDQIKKMHPNINIFFSPEFLREGQAIFDNRHPSRIIVSNGGAFMKEIAELFQSITLNSPKILFMDSSEAEAVKLFSNTYLALRVSFFNELDTFAHNKKLNAKNIIDGVSHDPRIGIGYNNPSFGYGGYCLPKDTKQLLANFESIPQELFSSIVKSNQTRKSYIAKCVLELNPKIVGIYRLIMKDGSDNFRESAVFDIINILKENNIKVIAFEPLLDNMKGIEIKKSLFEFKKDCQIIIANRMNDDLYDVKEKIISRDIFMEN